MSALNHKNFRLLLHELSIYREITLMTHICN